MSVPEARRRESWLLIGIFAAAFLFHLYGVTYHWTMGFMAGHEFRQAQTAVTAYYIDQQDNFSLLYETPLVGKPWVSILLEVPVYEWSVVLVSRATGMAHVVAARTVTLTCFYLMLPAFYLLLGRMGVPKLRRLLVLALVLTAPVYIYYSRAFLMDSMELMCCVWFLLGFVRTMDERRWSWLALTVAAGTGAALVKSATFAVWLMPAGAYGVWLLWRDIRARTGWAAPLRTLLWGAATVVVALGSLRWWIAYTDPIKAAHASAWIFTSKNVSVGNWGLLDPRPLFSAALWRSLMGCWEQALMSRWLIFLGLAAGLALPSVRWRVLGGGIWFFLAQFLMPFAYAYQDYYFYSCALFLHAALGFALLGLLDSRAPRWICWLLLLVPFVAQATTYWQDYRKVQSIVHRGGFPFDDVLREHTPRNSVIVVAGNDWAAMTPLYSQRKALMIRNGLEYDHAYLERAFHDLAGEDVSALVLIGPLRANRDFINLATARFDMDPSAPTFSYQQYADVYVARLYATGLQRLIRNNPRFPDIRIPESAMDAVMLKGMVNIPPAVARSFFASISPGPFKVNFQFGVDWLPEGNGSVLSAHPNSDLWLQPPAEATQIKWSYGIFPGAYEKPGAMTNGVEFMIHGEMPDGQSRQIYYRLLDPARNPKDRGDQHEVIPYVPRSGETLRFSTRPNNNSAFDWAYYIRIRVK